MSSERSHTEKEEKLIGTALEFLSNPKIQKESEELKMSFLRQKGLSKKLIKEVLSLYELKIIEEEGKSSKKDTFEEKKKIPFNILILKSKKSKFLSLRERGLKKLNKDLLKKIHHLEILILNKNEILEIDEEFLKLKNLEILHMVNCGLDNKIFCKEIYNLKKLENLNLANNIFFDLNDFLKLENLEVLDLRNNEIFNIDYDLLNENKSLKKICLVGNNLKDFDRSKILRKDLVIKI